MKRKFDMSYKQDIIDGKVKVVTRDDRPVEILKWDRKDDFHRHIIAIVRHDDGYEGVYQYMNNGRCEDGPGNDSYNLYIITDEPEMTAFERQLDSCVENIQSSRGKERDKSVRYYARVLMEIARSQFESEQDQTDEQEHGSTEDQALDITAGDVLRFRDSHPIAWLSVIGPEVNAARISGKQDAMKDLPRWKRCEPSFYSYADNDAAVEMQTNFMPGAGDMCVQYQRLRKGNYYIPISELEKLPKEE